MNKKDIKNKRALPDTKWGFENAKNQIRRKCECGSECVIHKGPKLKSYIGMLGVSIYYIETIGICMTCKSKYKLFSQI